VYWLSMKNANPFSKGVKPCMYFND